MNIVTYKKTSTIPAKIEDVFKYCTQVQGFEKIFPLKLKWHNDKCDYMQKDTILDFSYKLFPYGWFRHKARITHFEENKYFCDIKEQGFLYSHFEHHHYFSSNPDNINETILTDEIKFSLGFFGLFNNTIGKLTLDNTFKKRHINIINHFQVINSTKLH